MSNEISAVKERIACPYVMPNEIQDPIKDVKWCYFVFYENGKTGIDFAEPSLSERAESWKYFFKNT